MQRQSSGIIDDFTMIVLPIEKQLVKNFEEVDKMNMEFLNLNDDVAVTTSKDLCKFLEEYEPPEVPEFSLDGNHLGKLIVGKNKREGVSISQFIFKIYLHNFCDLSFLERIITDHISYKSNNNLALTKFSYRGVFSTLLLMHI